MKDIEKMNVIEKMKGIEKMNSIGKYDLIAFDMDGTLLNSQKKITDKTKMSIEKAINAGKIVTLSTGRCLPELYEHFERLPLLRYCIAISGALIYDIKEEKIVFSKEIQYETVEKMFDIAADYDVMIHLHSLESYVEREQIKRMPYYHMAPYVSMFEKVTHPVENLREYYEKNRFPVYKFNIYNSSLSDREKLKKIFSELDISMCYAEEASLECSALGISKATGLEHLCSHLGIPVSATIAVGDSDNDIEILKKAGMAIVMSNGKEHIKEMADAIVASNDADGCAEAIEKYLL